MRTESGCRLPDTCYRTICLRQPPTLFDSALHVFSKMVYNIEHFELTTDTTYQQYMYAYKSNRVKFDKLFPPEYLIVRIIFRF
jgi:hypothetical protein